ncbi:class I adenylate-forming enzyme family protein [Metasolibacillus meyeri]|uniref:Class I adenylate-forming enzyme family protein n=1 Tax=Metasolibacillus meyeri TaxID=1071052 RepID=A0AAW9NUV1_9BACL|nr:class I adenylate-forming enzyme family protein [Metasolibacillus meyeri]MEC1178646.1 class I adenylate-forming enzyme family protein [Metasolibacillus meyeri]
MFQNVGDFLLNSVNNYPHKIALITSEEKLTYKMLERKVASFQTKLEINKGDVILLLLPNSVEYVITYFSIVLQGGIILPIYWNSTEDELRKTIDFINPTKIITNTIGYEKVKYKQEIVFIFDNVIDNNLEDREIKKVNINPDEIALILQTSGTTSKPKFVPLSHNNLIFNVINHSNSVGLTSDDNVLISLPMQFGYCNTSQFLTHIYLSSTVYIYKGKILLPNHLLKIIDKNSISVMTMVPSGLQMLLSFFKRKGTVDTYNLKSLRYICFGGGTLSKKDYQELKSLLASVDFVQTYGLTEAGPRVTSLVIKEDYDPTDVGKPFEGISIEIRDSQGQPIKDNVPGEVFIKSPGQMKGYYKSNTNIIENGFLKTGDIGFINSNGHLYIIGRIKNIIKYSGFRINPEEVEKVIYDHFSVDKCLVTSIKSSLYGEIPVAKIVLNNTKTVITETEIINICKKNLSNYKIPHKVEFVEKLDVTNTGKLKR